jgi:hypothetical protein
MRKSQCPRMCGTVTANQYMNMEQQTTHELV